MNKKMGIVASVLGLLVIGGGLVYSNTQPTNKVVGNQSVESIQGTSEMKKEVLAGEGVIEEIKANSEGVVIKVRDNEFLVHASTNIFEGDTLLEVSDLKEGQNVVVYNEEGELNVLRVEIVK